MHKSRKIGIMGGAFDPIHIGHLVTAEEVYHQFSLDEVIFMPSGIPAHKEAHSMLGAQQRYEMTALAVADNPHFYVSRYEIDKDEVCYSIDTMKSIHDKSEPDTQIFFITGADAILEILTWKEPWKISEYGHLIAASRPGYDLARLEDILQGDKRLEALKEHVLSVTVPALAISSTDIRERIATRRPIRYLVPLAVEEYIKTHRIYHS